MLFFKKSPKKETLEDGMLLSTYRQSGDPALVGTLFERYSLQIYSICKGYMKDEDSAQDASMEMYEYLLGELKKYEIENFRNWLGRATRNFCLMRIRKEVAQQKKATLFKADLGSFMENEDDLHLSGENGDDSEGSLYEALGNLNEKQRNCIELFFLKKMSYDEVVAATGYSMNEVKSYIQNGKRNLRLILEKKK